jgi:hypothetical protein
MLMLSEPPYTAIRHHQRSGSPDYFPQTWRFDRVKTPGGADMILYAGKTMA